MSAGGVDSSRAPRYSRCVTRDARVQLADARDDRLRPWLLIAIGAATFAAGVGAARGLRNAERRRTPEIAAMADTTVRAAPRLRSHADTPHETPPPDTVIARDALADARSDASTNAPSIEREPQAAVPEPQAAVPEPQAAVVVPAEPRPAQASTGEATPTPTRVAIDERPRARVDEQPITRPAAAETPRTELPARGSRADDTPGAEPSGLQRVFVAYVRCDGLPQSAGRFPCPRDPWLETRVWRALNQLPQCGALAEQRGEGELRLDFDRYGVVSLRFESRGEGDLTPNAVLQCAEQGLGRIHTSLRPERMVVAFRFRLR